MYVGRFESDRIGPHISGRLRLVEVRSRRTCEQALAPVGRAKQRRLAVMPRHLAKVTGESVTIEVEAVGERRIDRKVLEVVQPDLSDHN